MEWLCCLPDRDTVYLQKYERSGHPRAFIPVNKCLRFGEVKCVGCGDIEQISVGIVPSVVRLSGGTGKSRLITKPILSSMRFEREPMQILNLLQREKNRFAHWLSFRISSRCSSKTQLAAVSKAALPTEGSLVVAA